MRLTKVDKDGHWLSGTKTDWAIEDKNGNWWIYKYKNRGAPVKTKINPKKKACMSSKFDVRDYIILTLSSLLGIALGFLVAIATNMI